MPFQLKDVLDSVGPTASLVFAAWIFLSYLQARYTEAAKRYRELVDNYRNGIAGPRVQSVSRQILLYKQRCNLMRIATNIGVVSAMLLITTLVLAAFEVILPLHPAIAIAGSACAIVGLLLVIAAAACVIVENRLMQRAMLDELSDVPGVQEDAWAPRENLRTQPTAHRPGAKGAEITLPSSGSEAPAP